MLTLLVAGLAIGCSSEPAATAAPVPNLTEKEAIGIARSSDPKGNSDYTNGGCWWTRPKIVSSGTTPSNFFHTESASFKPSGIWIVTAKSSWDYEDTYGQHSSQNWPCTYVVDDATGRVTQN